MNSFCLYEPFQILCYLNMFIFLWIFTLKQISFLRNFQNSRILLQVFSSGYCIGILKCSIKCQLSNRPKWFFWLRSGSGVLARCFQGRSNQNWKYDVWINPDFGGWLEPKENIVNLGGKNLRNYLFDHVVCFIVYFLQFGSHLAVANDGNDSKTKIRPIVKFITCRSFNKNIICYSSDITIIFCSKISLYSIGDHLVRCRWRKPAVLRVYTWIPKCLHTFSRYLNLKRGWRRSSTTTTATTATTSTNFNQLQPHGLQNDVIDYDLKCMRVHSLRCPHFSFPTSSDILRSRSVVFIDRWQSSYKLFSFFRTPPSTTIDILRGFYHWSRLLSTHFLPSHSSSICSGCLARIKPR